MKKIILFIVLLAVIGATWWRVSNRKTENISNPDQSQNQTQINTKPSLPVIDLQPTIDSWASKQSGSASVVVIDLANNKTIASLNPDKAYFSASIYKLYVAYEGYQKVADGTYKMDDSYLAGYNRGKCLDEMIRSSYSPCGEKMWAELGKENLTKKLKTYGLKNTDMTGLQTSAADAAIILQRLFEKKDLSEEHVNLFLDSLKTQPEKYRVGLPAGFKNSTVYNKVGWNENLEWHDTAIVTFKNGRNYVVSVLTRGVGRANIVELGKAIEAKLSE